MSDKIKILIVDDEENMRITMSDILNEKGYETVEAASGEEAIQVAMAQKPQIVLLDTVMVGMDGHETCRKIKNLKGVNPKVIIVTGKIDAVDAGRAREMGADDYLVKTSDFTELLASIEKLSK